MIHLLDGEDSRNQGLNSERRFLCGIVGRLPEGDVFYYLGWGLSDVLADCPGCNPTPRKIGTPLSQLSGRPGEPGFAKFCAIAKSWGYD
jgi:hypothetical protein